MEENTDLFSQIPLEGVEQEYDPFALVGTLTERPAIARPIASQMVALSALQPEATRVNEDLLSKAQEVLDAGEELNVRSKLAVDRSVRSIRYLEDQRNAFNANPANIDPKAYQSISNEIERLYNTNFEQEANTALEKETLDRIHDLTVDDPQQAKVMWDLYKNGNALKQHSDWMTKQMIMAQRMEEMASEYGETNWGMDLLNGLIGITNPVIGLAQTTGAWEALGLGGGSPLEFAAELTPLRSNFARSGILDDAGIKNTATSMWNWIMSGSGLERQSDSLWNLPLNEFAEAMKKDGRVMESIRSNASLLGHYSSGTAYDVLKALNYQSDVDRQWANAWGVADPALLLPIGRILSVPKLLVRAGSRKMAGEQIVAAIRKLETEGAEGALRATGTAEKEVIEAIEPKAISPSSSTPHDLPLNNDVDALSKAMPEAEAEITEAVQRSSRFRSDVEIQQMYDDSLEKYKQANGSSIVDVESKPFFEETLTGTVRPFSGAAPEQGGAVHFWEVAFGRKGGGGFAKESTARKAANSSNRTDAEVFRGVDGQWYYKSRFNINENGFLTEALEKTNGGGVFRWVRSARNKVDRVQHAKNLADENAANQLRRVVRKHITGIRKGLSPQENGALDEVLKYSANKSKWLSENELDDIFRHAYGDRPTATMKTAYNKYRALNDLDYKWRNSLIYESRATQGGESVEFSIRDSGPISRDAVVVDDPSLRPPGAVFDATEGNVLEGVSAATIRQMSDDGYVMLKLFDNIKTNDDQVVKYVMVKGGNLKRGPLRTTQLGYRDGPHRAYTGRYFAKQTAADAKNRLINPNVLLTGDNPNVMDEWVDTMNQAIRAVRDGAAMPEARPTIRYGRDKLQKELDEVYGGDLARMDAAYKAEIKDALDEGAEVFIIRDGKRVQIDNARDFRIKDVMGPTNSKKGKTLSIEYKNAGVSDPAWFDANIFKGRAGYPTGDEFLRMVDNGEINSKYDIVKTVDREMPAEYTAREGINLELVDEFDMPELGYYRHTGQMYYSGRGEALKTYTGEFAETVNPWETLNNAFNNLARTSTLQNYKQQYVDRFRNAFGQYLDVDNLAQASPWTLAQAPLKGNLKDLNPEVRRAMAQVRAEQEAMRRVLGFDHPHERYLRQVTESLGDWVIGKSKGTIRTLEDGTTVYEKSGREVIGNWMLDRSRARPLDFLRSVAFDLKLGLFNPSQLILQASTMYSSILLNPKYGLRGASIAWPMVWYARAGGAKAGVLEQFSKNGMWKLGGFESADEFKDFAQFMDKSGMMDLSGHLDINAYSGTALTGFKSKVNNFREAGRVFFYMPEQANRITGARIAWGELKDAGVQPGTARFREEMFRLTDDYTFNMMNTSAASFQNGLASIPAQFGAYSMRVFDAMYGKQFTAAQRMRLIVGSFAAFGTSAIVGADALAEFMKRANPDIPLAFTDERGDASVTNKVISNLDRGLLDTLIYQAGGVDVLAGERFGTGGFLTNMIVDIFGMSQYGERNFAEMVAGPVGSTTVTASSTLYDAIRWSVAESGAEDMPVARESWLRMLSEVSTFNNGLKASILAQSGYLRSKKGGVNSNIPPEAAMFVALGFQPGSVAVDGYLAGFIANKKESIKEAATQIRNWRQEAFLNKDVMEENLQKVNILMQSLPADIRDDVRRQSKGTDEFHDYVARKYDEDVQKAGNSGNSEGE